MMQPMPAEGWSNEIPHAGWKDASCHYLACEQDKILPPPVQEMFASTCAATIERCDAGHMVQITQPDTLVKFITKAAGSIS
jgi:pimeloyl-ACP methyl ester carboxylesterase